MSINIDDLLDATLDDLEDLPEFKPFPVGAHRILATLSQKEINGKAAIELDMKAIETLELTNVNDVPLKQGDSTNVAFMLDNEFGRGKLKNVLKVFGAYFGTVVNREIIEKTKDIECVILSGQRQDKNNPDRVYTDVKEIQIV